MKRDVRVVDIQVYDSPIGLQRVVLEPLTPFDEVIQLPLGSEVVFRVAQKDYVRSEEL